MPSTNQEEMQAVTSAGGLYMLEGDYKKNQHASWRKNRINFNVAFPHK